MPHYVSYELHQGYIHNWLVAGPHTTPVLDLERFTGDDYKMQIARERYRRLSQIHETPVDRGTFQVGADELTWRYYRCLDDHFVDQSTFCHTCHHLVSWANAQVELPDAGQRTMTLTTNGPADVWIDGQHVHRQEHFCHQDPRSISFTCDLSAGWHDVLVRFEEVAARECPYVMALHIQDVPGDTTPVRIATLTQHTDRWRMLEDVFEDVHAEVDVVHAGDAVKLHWLDEARAGTAYTFQVRDERDRIYQDGSPDLEPGGIVTAGHPTAANWRGDYVIAIRPRPEQYYTNKIR